MLSGLDFPNAPGLSGGSLLKWGIGCDICRERRSQPQELPVDEQQAVQSALRQLWQHLQQQSHEEHDPDRPLAKIVLAHLDKYWEHLMPDPLPAADSRWTRTTNQLESDWGPSNAAPVARMPEPN